MQKTKHIIAFLLIFSIYNSNAQSSTSKYNNLTNRYEYFNGNGDLIGYKTYNSLQQQWEYFDVKAEPRYNTIKPAFNTEQLSETINSLNNRFDNNEKRIQDAINTINEKTFVLNLSEDVRYKINQRFNNEYIQAINRKTVRVNYESNSSTSNLITWLYEGINKIIKEEQNDIAINLENFSKYVGKYKVMQVNEIDMDKMTNIEDTSITYLNLENIYNLSFLRSGDKWKYLKLKFISYNISEKEYFFETDYGSITFKDNFNEITFYDSSYRQLVKYSKINKY